MLIQPTLQRLVLQTGLLAFLFILFRWILNPVSINLVYITFIVISIFRGIDAAIMNPSFHSITYFVSKYSIFILFHCVILWTGTFRSWACAMLCIWNVYFVGGPFFLNTIVHIMIIIPCERVIHTSSDSHLGGICGQILFMHTTSCMSSKEGSLCTQSKNGSWLSSAALSLLPAPSPRTPVPESTCRPS